MLTKSGSNKTVYLKPKESGKPEGAASDIPVVNNPVNTQSAPVATFNPTSANENTDVARSDLKDLRQSAVALGVSQKDGSNQIVQDWLDTGSDSGSENNDAAESDVEE